MAIEKRGNEEKQRKSKLFYDLEINMMLKYNLAKKEFDLLADLIYDTKSAGPGLCICSGHTHRDFRKQLAL